MPPRLLGGLAPLVLPLVLFTVLRGQDPLAQDPPQLPKPAPTKPAPSDEQQAALAKALCEALDRGDLDAVRKALADGASVEQGMGAGEDTTKGRTPLIHAVLSGRAEAVELLIGAGARLDAGDDAGHSPLMYAAIAKNAAMVRQLFRAGARLDVVDQAGNAASAYLEAESELAKEIEELARKNRALLISVSGEDLAGAWQMLEDGASPNANDGANSLLMAAVRRGDLELVPKLLAKGCRPDLLLVQSFSLETPLGLAAGEGSLELLRRLVEGRQLAPIALDTALASAAGSTAGERLERVKLLLANGANPARPMLLQTPALPAAAGVGDLETMSVLLAAGADQQAVDEALGRAVALPDGARALQFVRALLAIGANPSYDYLSTNALGDAARRANEEVLALLFERIDAAGLNTAVAQAARDGYAEGLGWLCAQAKGRIDFGFRPGLFPPALVGAIEKGHLECAKILLAAGADPNLAPTFDKDSPLIAAVRAQNREALELLLAAGADPTQSHEIFLRGQVSALGFAREQGVEWITQLLEQTSAGRDPLGFVLDRARLVHGDAGGFHRVQYENTTSRRKQTVYVRKEVESFGSLRTQEVFSLCYDAERAPTAEELRTWFLQRFGVGGLVLERPGATQKRWRVRLRVAVPCDVTPERLAAVLEIVQSTADDLESQFHPGEEDRL